MSNVSRRDVLKGSLIALGSGSVGALGTWAYVKPKKRAEPHAQFDERVLMSCESAIGPSPQAMNSLKNLPAITHKYFFHADNLRIVRSSLAIENSVEKNFIVMTPGAREAIRRCIVNIERNFKIESLIVTDHEYQKAQEVAAELKMKVIKIPADSKFKHDLDKFGKSHFPSIIYFSNPHLPFGGFFNPLEIEKFMSQNSENNIVLLDECYIHFLGPDFKSQSCTELTKKHKNLVIFRTFSKIYGLASLRVGYIVAHPLLLKRLFPSSYEDEAQVSAAALVAAVQALDDADHLKKAWKVNFEMRRDLHEFADANQIETIGGAGNFFTFLISDQISPEKIRVAMSPYLIGTGQANRKTYIRVALSDQESLNLFKERFLKLLKS